VVIGHPAPNHYLACSFYASLTTARQIGVGERHLFFLLAGLQQIYQPANILNAKERRTNSGLFAFAYAYAPWLAYCNLLERAGVPVGIGRPPIRLQARRSLVRRNPSRPLKDTPPIYMTAKRRQRSARFLESRWISGQCGRDQNPFLSPAGPLPVQGCLLVVRWTALPSYPV
jgi:hypothetical protein